MFSIDKYPNKFEEYFEYVMQKVQITTKKEEIEEIRKETKDLIQKVWEKALSKKGEFNLSRVESVGSMEEGSRLESPNEFDFMMILNLKDLPTKHFRLEEGCKTGFVKVFSDDLNVKWKDYFRGQQLHSWNLRQYFLSFLQKLKDPLSSSINIKIVKRDLSVLEKPEYEHIMLQLVGEYEIEAWNMMLLWKDKLDISVDTMPSLEIDQRQIEDLEKRLGNTLLHDSLNRRRAFTENQKCFLVPKGCQKNEADEGCGCWLVDFAPYEVSILKASDPIHKNCHKFLKYVLKSYHGLPSYMVKTTMMRHVEKCDQRSAKKACAIDMLRYILDCLDTATVEEYFMKDINIFGWKRADHLKTRSPAVMAILFEHHRRIFQLLCEILEKMSIPPNFKIYTNQISDFATWNSSMELIERVLPLDQHLNLMHDFIDDIEAKVEKHIREKNPNWSNIAELRKVTKPLLSKIQWIPYDDYEMLREPFLAEFPTLTKLLK